MSIRGHQTEGQAFNHATTFGSPHHTDPRNKAETTPYPDQHQKGALMGKHLT